jgi:hypothetical protein
MTNREGGRMKLEPSFFLHPSSFILPANPDSGVWFWSLRFEV